MSGQSMDKTEALSYEGRLRALRSAYNEQEEVRYDKQKPKSSPSSKKPTPNADEETVTVPKPYFRISRTGSPHGSINLARFASGEKDKENTWLLKKTTLYLENMYKEASFVKDLNDPDWAKKLLEHLITEQQKIWKKEGTFLSLDKLCPSGPLKEHYHKLIRGTSTFNPETQKGYLPLMACIHFAESQEKELHFPFANEALLITFFGKEQFEKIRDAEWPEGKPRPKATHQSNYALSYQELKSLLGEALDSKIEHFFDFKFHSKSYQLPKRSTDSSTNISAQILEEPSPR